MSCCSPLPLHELKNEGGEDELHGEIELSTRNDDGVRARQESFVNHRKQVTEVEAPRIPESDHDHRLVGCGDRASDEGVRCIDRWYALEIDIRLRKLRTHVPYIVRHPTQNGIGYCFSGISPRCPVPVNLLNPFQVDDGHDPDLQVGMLCKIDFVRDDASVQSFV